MHTIWVTKKITTSRFGRMIFSVIHCESDMEQKKCGFAQFKPPYGSPKRDLETWENDIKITFKVLELNCMGKLYFLLSSEGLKSQ